MRTGLLLLLLFVLPTSGCMFSEKSYPYDPHARIVIDPPGQTEQGRTTARQWLKNVSPRLNRLLPAHRKPSLLTDQLVTADGRPTDVVSHFWIKTDRLESIFVNFLGLTYSAQAIMTRNPQGPASPWEGFEDVWVPVRKDLQLAGRMGWARDSAGHVIDANCIVILPGLRGDNNVLRLRDLAVALRRNGFHVLALELRGMGLTYRRFPNCEYTWGILDTDDLLLAADWLQTQPHIRQTGLVGYSWGANQGLLVAWAEGRTSDEGIPPRLRRFLVPPEKNRRRFEAGVLVFSPIPRFEELMDKLEVEQTAWLHPVLAGLQTTIRDWMIDRRYPNPRGSIRELIKHIGLGYDQEVADGLDYLRLMPYKGLPVCNRLDAVRVPLLIVHAADDMVSPAQDVADLLATTNNPNVAAIMLPSSGHIGFGPYASTWYYNLILNFFDPVAGAVADRALGRGGTQGLGAGHFSMNLLTR